MTKKPQLEDWEVATIKAMLRKETFSNQEIVAYFSRPNRSINQGRIAEIKSGHERYEEIEKASDAELESFLEEWNNVKFPQPPMKIFGPAHPVSLREMFPLRSGEPIKLDVSETSTVEGKERFNWANNDKYCKTLAAMANNIGGYIIFGVKDGSFEISGIAHDRMEKFDLKKANEYITRNFNQEISLEKGQFIIKDKTIGFIYAHPAKNKPVICTFDTGSLKSGDIYYRYPGESRKIRAPELERMLKDRDKISNNYAFDIINRVYNSGVSNTAIINLKTGEVDGDRGRLFIEENLLNKVKLITEGKLSETEGSPTLRLIGSVEPATSNNQQKNRSIAVAISERDIHTAFLNQKCQYEPITYIIAQAHLQPLWLPIYYFSVEARLNKESLIDCLRKSDSQYKNRIERQIDRIKSCQPPSGSPSKENIKNQLAALNGNTPFSIENSSEARKYLQAIRVLTPTEFDLQKILSLLIDIDARFGSTAKMHTELRYAIAAVDVNWFGAQVI